MFDSLSTRLQDVFQTLRGEARLTPENIEAALREIRLALLEADVNFKVVKAFIDRVRDRATGQDVLRSLSPAQQVVKIVRDEMLALFGDAQGGLPPTSRRPRVILLLGLQGAGKTTTAGKLAKWLTKQGRHPLLVSTDVKRPAAIEQLNEGVKKQHYRTVQSNYLVLRQLASGFMTLNGDDSTKVQIKFEENPKLEALVDLIEAMPPKCKMVCFHHFVYTNHMISEKLTEIKVTHARIWGGQRDKIGELKRFKTDPDCRVLVINSRSGSASLNLQNANYCVFFEQPDSPIDRQQAERRVWRPGQTRRVLYYDFLVMGTVDQRLLASNKAGEDMLKKLLREGI